MDEEYTESVDTSADMDVSDVDVADDVPADIPDDVPEDDYSEADVADDVSDDVIDETVDDAEFDEVDESIEEDSIEPEADEIDESMDDIEEDTLDKSVESSDDYAELDDIPEDTDSFDEEQIDDSIDEAEIPEDTDDYEITDGEETFDEDILEDVAGTETTDETSDFEDTDASEQAESMTDTETTDETSDFEDTDASEQPEGMTETETTDENSDFEDTDASEQTEDVTDAEEGNHSDLETYDYETSPETQDALDPETSGEYVSANNPYRESWEESADEFSDGKDESEEWDSLKDVPFAGDAPSDAGEYSAALETYEAAEMPEINSVSDYMNSHNYGLDDFATYSQDPQWRQLMRQEHPDYQLPELSQESAKEQLSQYMNDHNYGTDNYAEYSQDPIWRELHSTAYPDYELPPLKDTTDQDIDVPTVTASDTENVQSKNPSDVVEGEMFGSFGTDKHINGSDSFIKGDNYEQFKRDYYSPDESSYEAYDTPKEIDISPSMIEGIHLGEKEVEDPSLFWSQHEKEGTLESFKEIAARIPDVRDQLASGKTMDELLDDPELSECASIYFANKPKVIENDGYYEFDSNGRHRILAAREAGYDIPVEVIGRRSKNSEIGIGNPDSIEEELHAEIGGDLSNQNGVDNKEYGLFGDKIRNFFAPSKGTDIIEPGVDDVTTPNQDVQERWTPPAIKGVDVKEPTADITPIETTRQSINMIDLPDGSKAKVFDHPGALRNTLPFSQGRNEYSKKGTCALADTGAWLKVAGSRHVENDVVGFASTHSDRQGRPLCSKSGGTLPSNIPDIWEHFGMPAYSDGSKNLENIAEAVESGRAVSVGVNAGTLWEQDNAEGIRIPQDCYGDGGANHAIGVMSCERDPVSGNITHFYINDTGRTYERDACRRISIGDFWKAFNVKRACATISKKPVW